MTNLKVKVTLLKGTASNRKLYYFFVKDLIRIKMANSLKNYESRLQFFILFF
jgi:hypothetical protein